MGSQTALIHEDYGISTHDSPFDVGLLIVRINPGYTRSPNCKPSLERTPTRIRRRLYHQLWNFRQQSEPFDERWYEP
jgi:hypothetical protein